MFLNLPWRPLYWLTEACPLAWQLPLCVHTLRPSEHLTYCGSTYKYMYTYHTTITQCIAARGQTAYSQTLGNVYIPQN